MADLHAAAAGIGLPASEIQRCYDHFSAQGWVRKNGQPVCNLKSLLAIWKAGFENRETAARAANPRNSGLHTGRTNFAALVAAQQTDAAPGPPPAPASKPDK